MIYFQKLSIELKLKNWLEITYFLSKFLAQEEKSSTNRHTCKYSK